MKTDICLILEGTYPYVSGGVSTWVHSIVSSLPDLTFSIIHISSTGDVIKTPQYEIPNNIIEFKEVFVHDFEDNMDKTNGKKEKAWEVLRQFYADLDRNDFSQLEAFYQFVIDKDTRSLNTHDLMFSKTSWNLTVELYQKISPEVSFVDFYWTMRLIHVPIFNLFNVELPDASVYHTVCTGYAGLLSAIAKLKKKAPVLLTEHGIYTHERRIDISLAKWIYSEDEGTARAVKSLGFFKDIWIKTFEILGKLTYDYADEIVTLFRGNQRMQIEDGADAKKISIIPNGVGFPEDYKRPDTTEKKRKTVGFVGRIVPIKGIKSFLRAMKIVQEEIPDVEVYLIGPGEENPDYFRECRILVRMLQLENNVVFTGKADVSEYYPLLDVFVLTSISEGQPLSILEAMSYGIPVVSTNVGASEDLIMGRDAEDEKLGEAGVVTNVGSPVETAKAVLEILGDKAKQKKMSEVGTKRVKTHYGKDAMIKGYRDLYESYLTKSRTTQKAS